MTSEQVYLELAVSLLLILTLIYGSLWDVKKREISSYLFIPVIVLALITGLILHGFFVISILSVIIFSLQFLAYDRRKYIIAIVPVIVIGSVALYYLEPGMLIPWGFEALFSLMVIGEVLFGVGDVKAIIAILFSTVPFSFALFGGDLLLPFSFMFFINLGIVSIIATFYGIYATGKATGTYGLSGTVEKGKDVDAVRFYTWDMGDRLKLRYKIPFVEFILFATLATLIVLKFNLPL